MTTTHLTTIVSFIFVVCVIPSISGRIDLRAFERDDGFVPYAFSCRRGRCGSLSTTHHRRSSDVRGLDGVDDVVGEVGVKPFGVNDRDDDDDRRIMTFPYCSTINIDECRSLLRHLERLRLWLLRRVSKPKPNLVVTGVDGTVVRLLDRRRRSAQQEVDTGDEKAADGQKVRPGRSINSYASFEASNRLLDQYHQWRKENGYGRNNARWGRAPPTDHEEDISGNASSDKESATTPSNSMASVHQRSPRSVVVEIEHEDELPASERDMLDTYLAWRESHGYGTLAGRWGR